MAHKAANFMLGLILITASAAGSAAEQARHWYTPWRKAPAAEAPVTPAPASAAAAAQKSKHWYTPWRKPPVPPPEVAHELDIARAGVPSGTGGVPAVAQYWNRNNLRVDLTGMAGPGSLDLKPVAGGAGWPVRIEFAVLAGSMSQLEVRGEKRVVYNVPAGGGPQVIQLEIGVYTPGTQALSLSWQ